MWRRGELSITTITTTVIEREQIEGKRIGEEEDMRRELTFVVGEYEGPSLVNYELRCYGLWICFGLIANSLDTLGVMTFVSGAKDTRTYSCYALGKFVLLGG